MDRMLDGPTLRLERFDRRHIPGLRQIAIDKEIWTYLQYPIRTESDFDRYVDRIETRIKDRGYFYYTIIDKKTGNIIGSTSINNINITNRKIEIGGTWLTRSAWGTGAQMEARYLLLDLAFSKNEIIRVEFRSAEANIRSQKAIEKLGAFKEGVLRADRINIIDGTTRNTVLYSIIRTEWHAISERLKGLLHIIK
jgi:N-acetyltransferase